jgi:hypothetical protein
MHRICLIAPNIVLAKRIATDCETLGVAPGNIHVVGKNHAIIEHVHLHRATIFQTTNLSKMLKIGLLAGACIGSIMGGYIFRVDLWETHIGLLGVGLFTLVGALLGLWASGLIGIGVQDPLVEHYIKPIEEGRYLLLIDLARKRGEVLAQEILAHYPEAVIANEGRVH